jgi:hypothetical protein
MGLTCVKIQFAKFEVDSSTESTKSHPLRETEASIEKVEKSLRDF